MNESLPVIRQIFSHRTLGAVNSLNRYLCISKHVTNASNVCHKLNCILRRVSSALSGSLFSQQFSACRVEGKIKQTENFVSSWNLCDLKQKCYSIKNRDILIRFWRRDVLHCWNYSLLWNKVASICMASIESYCKHRKLKMIFLYKYTTFNPFLATAEINLFKSITFNYKRCKNWQKLRLVYSRT